MRPSQLALHVTAAITLGWAAAACADPSSSSFGPTSGGPRRTTGAVTDSAAADSAARADSIATAAATVDADSAADAATSHVLVCQSNESYTDRRTIGPKGGSVGARGSRIYIPAGAVTEPTEFEFIVPAGPYMAVEIHAVGHAAFTFAVPANLVINYARCPKEAVPDRPLAGAYVNRATGQVLQMMGGKTDRGGKKVSFTTGHLSGYAVAY